MRPSTTKGELNRFGTLITLLLVAIIIIGSTVAWLRHSESQAVEISITPPSSQEQLDQIYIGGAITYPGFYPLTAEDSISDIIEAAGGTNGIADLSQLELYISEADREHQPQKVNINRAEAWLLEALPGIGETRAKAIIAYRQNNGPFHHTSELTRVEGIGATTYEQIKQLITVAD
ncbi:MAG TPA: ComEA family DNA-binding protein [Dehalococcoidales bacterium]|nr:ComEA family DNA-binding protein [Dehalococcoidales bacterium]